MTPPRKKGELESSIINEPVMYTLNKKRVTLQSKDKKTVQLNDGGFGNIQVDRIALQAQNPYVEPMLSQAFDPVKDKDIIDFIDAQLERNPAIASVNGITKLSDGEVPPPAGLNNWVELDADKIAVFIDSGIDVEQAMKYELQQAEPRTDVIKLLEAEYRKVNKDKIEQSDAAPTI